MLIETTRYNDGDILSIKLSSGEEVIGKYVKDTDEHLILDRPLMLAMSQKGVGMAPVLMTVNPESKLKFSKTAVMVVAESDQEIAKQYLYQTTGIQPVGSSSIIK